MSAGFAKPIKHIMEDEADVVAKFRNRSTAVFQG
jgi:hypothetical protein